MTTMNGHSWVGVCPPGKTRKEGLRGALTTQSQFLPFLGPSSSPLTLPPDLGSRSQTNSVPA